MNKDPKEKFQQLPAIFRLASVSCGLLTWILGSLGL